MLSYNTYIDLSCCILVVLLFVLIFGCSAMLLRYKNLEHDIAYMHLYWHYITTKDAPTIYIAMNQIKLAI